MGDDPGPVRLTLDLSQVTSPLQFYRACSEQISVGASNLDGLRDSLQYAGQRDDFDVDRDQFQVVELRVVGLMKCKPFLVRAHARARGRTHHTARQRTLRQRTTPQRTAPHRTAPHCTAPHHTTAQHALHCTAPHVLARNHCIHAHTARTHCMHHMQHTARIAPYAPHAPRRM